MAAWHVGGFLWHVLRFIKSGALVFPWKVSCAWPAERARHLGPLHKEGSTPMDTCPRLRFRT